MTDELDYIGICTFYDGIGKHVKPEQVAGRKILGIKVTGSANVAATWTGLAAANQVSSQNQQLEVGHQYALAYIYSYASGGIAVRAKHNDWGSCKPGGMQGTTIYHKKNMLDFAEHGTLPVFSSSTPLDIESFNSGTGTPVITIGVYDVTDIGGSVGIEDFNLSYGNTTNGTTTFTVFTVALGDTFTVKDGIGTPHLVGTFMTGTAPLRGQIRSTDKSFQPNPVELPYGFTTVAGDFLKFLRYAYQELQPNSLLITQGTS